MQIKETSEDPRLRDLAKPLPLPTETREPEQVQPVAPSRPTEKRREWTTRSHGERRTDERRKQQRRIFLDTRNPHDRRTRKRRAEDHTSEQAVRTPPLRGIDVLC